MKTLSSLFLACLIWSLALPSWAAITLSASSVASTGITGATSETTSVTIDATTTFLGVCVANGGSSAGGPSGVTFDGGAMTASRTDSWTGADNGTSSLFYKVNPTVKTANVVASWSASGKNDNGGGFTVFQLKGVNTASPIDASNGSNSGNTFTTSISVDTTVVTDQAWLISCAEGRNSGGVTLDTSLGAVSISNRVVGSDGLGVAYRPNVGIGDRNMNWTQSSDWGGLSVIAIKPAAAGSTSKGGLMMLGAD